jgi:hypothetical protein
VNADVESRNRGGEREDGLNEVHGDEVFLLVKVRRLIRLMEVKRNTEKVRSACLLYAIFTPVEGIQAVSCPLSWSQLGASLEMQQGNFRSTQ